jgi:hypothetical protein
MCGHKDITLMYLYTRAQNILLTCGHEHFALVAVNTIFIDVNQTYLFSICRSCNMVVLFYMHSSVKLLI